MDLWKERLAIYDRLVSQNPSFERKGKTMPYTSANGYMFSMLNKSAELGIRLPKEVAKEFKQQHNTGEFISHGAVIKDYVLVPDDLLNDLDLLGKYLEQGYQHVMSLKPK